MSKTILQIANELSVSKQSVYKRVKGSLYTVVAPYVHTVDGVMYIDEAGENAIKQAFSSEPKTSGVHTDIHTDVHTDIANIAAIEALRQQLDAQNEQLKEKDRQIATLHRLLEQQNTLALGDKQAILQLTGEQEESTSSPEEPPTATEEPNKTGFLDRVKQFFQCCKRSWKLKIGRSTS